MGWDESLKGFSSEDTNIVYESVKEELDNKVSEIDPAGNLDWEDLTIGWAIGKGYTIEQALDIGPWIRYHTDLC